MIALALVLATTVSSDGGTSPLDAPMSPLLVYGKFEPKLGTWVEYRWSTRHPTQTRTVRVAHVAKPGAGSDPVAQIEIEVDSEPPALTVLWLRLAAEGEARVVRLALWIRPHPAIAVPMDRPAMPPGSRGTMRNEAEDAVRAGGRRIPAHRTVYDIDGGGTARVWRTPEVPLFGVARMELPAETWTYTRQGDGAVTGLTTVPMTVPRLNRKE